MEKQYENSQYITQEQKSLDEIIEKSKSFRSGRCKGRKKLGRGRKSAALCMYEGKEYCGRQFPKGEIVYCEPEIDSTDRV